jgi:cytochrome c553
MRYIPLKTAALAIVSIAASVLLAHAESLAIRNCTWCHGSSAQGYTPAPRLAGQRALYMENQLVSFRTHARNSPFSKQYMWGAAANLSPQAVRDLAVYFSSLPAAAANDGDHELTAFGRTIYQQGLPDANIAACVACHGPNAEGVAEIPRLGGLAYTYLKRRLQQWGEGYHATARPPMPRIAGKLSRDQIEALASYLSFVK